MRFLEASRFVACGLVFVFLNAKPAWSQKGGSGPGSATTGSAPVTTGTSTSPSPTTTSPSSLPSSTNPSNRLPGTGGPVFLSGRVMTDDGSPVDSNTRIERVCGITVHLEGHVDSKGRFAFQVGSQSTMDMDASTSSISLGPRGTLGSGIQDAMPSTSNLQGSSGNLLSGCELRASAAGYHSDSVELSGRQLMDNPDLGTIVLHHLGKVEGSTTSLTTLAAPKADKKLYEKGLQLAQRSKFDEAVKDLQQATSQYPQYAVAWEALGEIESKQGQPDQAKTAFEAAMKADPRYVNPYEGLAFYYTHAQKWQDAAEVSARGIALDPVEFPGLFWSNAIACYNLRREADAEKSVRALLKLDTRHHFPQAEKMMGELLLDQKNVPEAAVHMKAYLALAPNAPDAVELRQWLGKVEQASAQTAPGVPAQ